MISGLVAGLTVSSVGASTINSNKPYAKAQLLKLSDMPPGYTKSGDLWSAPATATTLGACSR